MSNRKKTSADCDSRFECDYHTFAIFVSNELEWNEYFEMVNRITGKRFLWTFYFLCFFIVHDCCLPGGKFVYFILASLFFIVTASGFDCFLSGFQSNVCFNYGYQMVSNGEQIINKHKVNKIPNWPWKWQTNTMDIGIILFVEWIRKCEWNDIDKHTIHSLRGFFCSFFNNSR